MLQLPKHIGAMTSEARHDSITRMLTLHPGVCRVVEAGDGTIRLVESDGPPRVRTHRAAGAQ